MKSAAILAASFVVLTLSSAHAQSDIASLYGSTVTTALNTYQPDGGFTSSEQSRYYFVKDGRHALMDFDAESYGRGKGIIYTLDDRTCDLLHYDYPYEGRKITGQKHVCGQMFVQGNAITLIDDSRDDNGLGHVVEYHQSITIEVLAPGNCRVTGLVEIKTAYGSTEITKTGHCQIHPGRAASMFE